MPNVIQMLKSLARERVLSEASALILYLYGL